MLPEALLNPKENLRPESPPKRSEYPFTIGLKSLE